MKVSPQHPHTMFYGDTATPVCSLSKTAFMLQVRSWMAVAETVWPSKPKCLLSGFPKANTLTPDWGPSHIHTSISSSLCPWLGIASQAASLCQAALHPARKHLCLPPQVSDTAFQNKLIHELSWYPTPISQRPYWLLLPRHFVHLFYNSYLSSWCFLSISCLPDRILSISESELFFSSHYTYVVGVSLSPFFQWGNWGL